VKGKIKCPGGFSKLVTLPFVPGARGGEKGKGGGGGVRGQVSVSHNDFNKIHVS